VGKKTFTSKRKEEPVPKGVSLQGRQHASLTDSKKSPQYKGDPYTLEGPSNKGSQERRPKQNLLKKAFAVQTKGWVARSKADKKRREL